MQSFYINISSLLKNPYELLKELVEVKKDTNKLSFTFLLIFLIAACQYISYTIIFNATSSIFTYTILMLLYGSLFFLSLFIDSSIINHFLNNNNEYNFSPKDTLTLLAISLHPYLFLPAIAILLKYLNMENTFCLAVLSSFIWAIVVKFKMLRKYKAMFSISTRSLIFLPCLVQITVFMLIIIISGISIFSAIFGMLGEVNQFLYMI